MYYKVAVAMLSVTAGTLVAADTVVSTGQYDTYRTGANLNEKSLKANKVDTRSFGRLGAYAVDGDVFAQPLYVSGQKAPGKNGGPVNVLYVATMHNSIYAFDADNPDSAPLW